MKRKSHITIFSVFLFCCLSSSPAFVFSDVIDIPTIEAEALKNELYHGAPMVLANALSSIEFKDLTIKESVNIPSSKVQGNLNLPKDKDELFVFFCKGPG